jgi:hypothetical protein
MALPIADAADVVELLMIVQRSPSAKNCPVPLIALSLSTVTWLLVVKCINREGFT